MHSKLVIIDGPDKGREVKITKKIFRIGRSTDSDIVLSDDRVSRNHAELSINEKGLYIVKDNRSKNGIFVNGLRLLEHCLNNGDVIQIGQNRLLFQKSDANALGRVEEIRDPLNLSKSLSPEVLDPDSGFFESQDGEEPTKLTPIEERSQDPCSQNLKLRTKALYQVAKALSHVEDDSTMIKAVMNILIQSIPSERIALILAEKDMKYIPRFLYSRDGRDPKPSAGGLREIVKKFQVRNYSVVSSTDEIRLFEGEMNGYSMISAIKARDAVLGLIYADCPKDEYSYSNDDLEMFEAIADQIAIGLEKSRLSMENKEMSARLTSLAKHLSPEIAEAVTDTKKPVLESPFEAKEKEVTVLFSDIADFTSLSEKLTPPEIAALLNEYFSRMVEIIIANKGTINKFIGDAVMAIFGAPISCGNDAENAVNSALQMIEALHIFHTQIDEMKRFKIRIGINTGNAVVGVIGSEKRMEYTVLGDTVNCASRIEHLAEPNGIAVGELTHEKVKDKFVTEATGQVQVKGKSKPINVYRIKGKK